MAASIPKTMRALQIQKQGGFEVLEIREIPVPQPGNGEVLIKTEWAGVS
jgi:NADPH:quinone reductase